MTLNLSSDPAIVQAICQIQCSPRESSEGWDGKWFGRFLTALGSDYDMEPITTPGFVVQNNAQGAPKIIQDPVATNQMLYRHKNQKYFIQLAPWTITISHVHSYDGWETFENQLIFIWTTLYSVINPSTITRVGMRYINRIPRLPGEKVNDWIRPTDLIPNRIVSQTTKFYFRCEVPEDDKSKLILGIAEEQSGVPVLPIIFDLDAITIKNIPADSRSLAPVLNYLHGVIRVEFDHSITPKYKNRLNQILV
jgi:uncharacterized protein (TIGR04255 family)